MQHNGNGYLARIEKRAYFLYRHRITDGHQGDQVNDWLNAEWIEYEFLNYNAFQSAVWTACMSRPLCKPNDGIPRDCSRRFCKDPKDRRYLAGEIKHIAHEFRFDVDPVEALEKAQTFEGLMGMLVDQMRRTSERQESERKIFTT